MRQLCACLRIDGVHFVYRYAPGRSVGECLPADQWGGENRQAWVFGQSGRSVRVIRRDAGIREIENNERPETVPKGSSLIDKGRSVGQCPHIQTARLNWDHDRIRHQQRYAQS